jgi:hypothetical protein
MPNRIGLRILAAVAAVVFWLLTAAAFFVAGWGPGTIPDRSPSEYPGMVAFSLVGALFTGLFLWLAVLCSGYLFEGRWPRRSLYVPLTGAVVLMDVAAIAGG